MERLKVTVKIEGLDTVKTLADEVIKKAEELEQAVHRLNEAELTVRTYSKNKEPDKQAHKVSPVLHSQNGVVTTDSNYGVIHFQK